MIAQKLKSAFDPYGEFPLSFWEKLAAQGESLEVKKEQVIKNAGTRERHLYLILQGSGGILVWNENNFKCADLLFENEFLCDYLSFLTHEPTPYEVMIFEDSELFKISKQKLEDTTNQSEFGDKFWRCAAEALFIDKQIQQLQLLTLTAAERYQLMLEHQPFIIQRIPQKYVASYLGVTPQSLSRIRKSID